MLEILRTVLLNWKIIIFRCLVQTVTGNVFSTSHLVTIFVNHLEYFVQNILKTYQSSSMPSGLSPEDSFWMKQTEVVSF